MELKSKIPIKSNQRITKDIFILMFSGTELAVEAFGSTLGRVDVAG